MKYLRYDILYIIIYVSSLKPSLNYLLALLSIRRLSVSCRNTHLIDHIQRFKFLYFCFQYTMSLSWNRDIVTLIYRFKNYRNSEVTNIGLKNHATESRTSSFLNWNRLANENRSTFFNVWRSERTFKLYPIYLRVPYRFFGSTPWGVTADGPFDACCFGHVPNLHSRGRSTEWTVKV